MRLNQNRIWEIDAIRGLLILAVLCGHLYACIDEFCINGYYKIDSYVWIEATDPLHFWFDWGEDGVIHRAFLSSEIYRVWSQLILITFFTISGICTAFTNSSKKRVFRMLAAGYSISAFTFLVSILTGEEQRFIRFGVILCYGYCHLIFFAFLQKSSNGILLILSIPILIMGYYLQTNPVYTHISILYPIGFQEYGCASREYFPIMPYLGWLMIGVVIGRTWYAEKKSLIHFPLIERLTRPLQWLGKHSSVIYLMHIPIFTIFFCGIGYILHLF